MAQCSNCGSVVTDGSPFCPYCGSSMGTPATPQPQVAQPIPPQQGWPQPQEHPQTWQPQPQQPQPQAWQPQQTGYAPTTVPMVGMGQPTPARQRKFPVAVVAVVAAVLVVALVGGLATNWYGLAGGGVGMFQLGGSSESASIQSAPGVTGEDAIRQQIAIDFSASPASRLLQMSTSLSEDDLAIVFKAYDDAQGPDGKYPSLRRFHKRLKSALSQMSDAADGRISSAEGIVFIAKEYLFRGMDITIDGIEQGQAQSATEPDRIVTLTIQNDWARKAKQCMDDVLSGEYDVDTEAYDEATEEMQAETADIQEQYEDGAITADEAADQFCDMLRSYVAESSSYEFLGLSGLDDDPSSQVARAIRESPDYDAAIDTMIDIAGDEFKYQLLEDEDAFWEAQEEQQFISTAFVMDAMEFIIESQGYSVEPRQVTYTYGSTGAGWIISAEDSDAAEANRILGTDDFGV